MPHHVAIYNGKQVVIDYVEPAREFKVACQRIRDNGAEGVVVTPHGKRYAVTQRSRMAKLLPTN